MQVIYIWNEALGHGKENPVRKASSYNIWQDIENIIAQEAGLFRLGFQGKTSFSRCKEYLLTAQTEDALDIIELSFRAIDIIARDLDFFDKQYSGITLDADEAIEDLNIRFREHNIGYQYVGGELVRVDSQYLHAEAVKPAIGLLQEEDFLALQRSFLKHMNIIERVITKTLSPGH